MLIGQLSVYAQSTSAQEKTYTAQMKTTENMKLKSLRVSPKNIKVELGTPENEVRQMIIVEALYKGEKKWVPVTDYQMDYDQIKDKVGTYNVEIIYTQGECTEKTMICVKICKPRTTNYVAYVGGYEDGTFRAEQPVTREELATMIARILTEGKVPEEANTYPDLDPNRYSTDAINYVTKLGLFAPYQDGTFKTKNPVTKQELEELLPKLKEYGEGSIKGFKQKGDLLTRAEAVVLLTRLFERDCQGESFPNKYSDLKEDYWAYTAIVCATNSFTKTE